MQRATDWYSCYIYNASPKTQKRGRKNVNDQGPGSLPWESFLYMTEELQSWTLNSMVIWTRPAQWQHPLTRQHGWRKSLKILTTDEEQHAINGHQERDNTSSLVMNPLILFNPKLSTLTPTHMRKNWLISVCVCLIFFTYFSIFLYSINRISYFSQWG